MKTFVHKLFIEAVWSGIGTVGRTDHKTRFQIQLWSICIYCKLRYRNKKKRGREWSIKMKTINIFLLGVDDAMAIFMALEAHRRKDIEILAFTLVVGNTKVENQGRNIHRILQLVPEIYGQVRI